MRLGLIISTYDRYRPVAEFTRRMIARYWRNAPEVFLCGCRERPDDHYLPLRDDPRDWIGIMRAAVEDLLARGFTTAYYVMDDCPPLGPCHARHLNATLPRLLHALRASCISLVGWDQRRESRGPILDRRHYRLQRHAVDFPWRYSTDPCLWDLRAFRDILDALTPTDQPASRSAWAFERRLGRMPSVVPPPWEDSSYRIFGLGMLGGAFPCARACRLRAQYRLIDLMRLLARPLAQPARVALDRWIGTETHFYDGPYPTYWAGVMTKGAFNEEVRRFLTRHGRRRYLAELLRAVAEARGSK